MTKNPTHSDYRERADHRRIFLPVSANRDIQLRLWYCSIRSSNGFVVALLRVLPQSDMGFDIETGTKWTAQMD
jgi:hypothetical protein